MATRFDYTKLIVENLKVIVGTVILIMTFLGSALSYTVIDNTEKDELTEAMKDQIEVLVDYKPKTVVSKGCNCSATMNRLIQQHVKEHKGDH